jgi:hypothetical protein
LPDNTAERLARVLGAKDNASRGANMFWGTFPSKENNERHEYLGPVAGGWDFGLDNFPGSVYREI